MAKVAVYPYDSIENDFLSAWLCLCIAINQADRVPYPYLRTYCTGRSFSLLKASLHIHTVRTYLPVQLGVWYEYERNVLLVKSTGIIHRYSTSMIRTAGSQQVSKFYTYCVLNSRYHYIFVLPAYNKPRTTVISVFLSIWNVLEISIQDYGSSYKPSAHYLPYIRILSNITKHSSYTTKHDIVSSLHKDFKTYH